MARHGDCRQEISLLWISFNVWNVVDSCAFGLWTGYSLRHLFLSKYTPSVLHDLCYRELAILNLILFVVTSALAHETLRSAVCKHQHTEIETLWIMQSVQFGLVILDTAASTACNWLAKDQLTADSAHGPSTCPDQVCQSQHSYGTIGI